MSLGLELRTPRSAPAVLAGITLHENVLALLDRAAALVGHGDAVAAFRLLTPPLSALWSEARATGQDEAMRHWCRQHPLHDLVLQDPFTARAASKPRGYAGDAVMMDYIYNAAPPEGTSTVGRDVFSATTRAGMGLSVVYRRHLLRSLIDDTVVVHERPRLLSVAAGHCRELQGSLALHPGFAGEFVALDQDGLSCTEVEASTRGSRVQVVHGGVRELLAASAEGGAPSLSARLGSFDLIYSAGLYDYLPEALAKRLTRRLFQMLRPGGRLLVANFVPGGSGRGYMELFMDWTLILRDETEMRAIADYATAAGGAAGVESFLDPHRNVVYVELRRAPLA